MIFLGLKFWPKVIFWGFMKDAVIFLGWQKNPRGIFLGCKKGLRDFFAGILKIVVILLGRKILDPVV